MLFFSVSPPPSRSVPLLKQFQNMYVHCLIYLIIIFNVGSDLEVERWRKTNEKKERGREGVCEREIASSVASSSQRRVIRSMRKTTQGHISQ